MTFARLMAAVQDPFAKKEVYHDGPINSFFIKYFSAKMAEQLGRELLIYQSSIRHSNLFLWHGSCLIFAYVLLCLRSSCCPLHVRKLQKHVATPSHEGIHLLNFLLPSVLACGFCCMTVMWTANNFTVACMAFLHALSRK